jgi:hypothetical protein
LVTAAQSTTTRRTQESSPFSKKKKKEKEEEVHFLEATLPSGAFCHVASHTFRAAATTYVSLRGITTSQQQSRKHSLVE